MNRLIELCNLYYLTLLGAQLLNSIIYLSLALFVSWRFGLMALVAGLILIMIFRAISVYVRNISRNLATENGNLSKLLIQFFKDLNILPQRTKLINLKEILIYQ